MGKGLSVFLTVLYAKANERSSELGSFQERRSIARGQTLRADHWSSQRATLRLAIRPSATGFQFSSVQICVFIEADTIRIKNTNILDVADLVSADPEDTHRLLASKACVKTLKTLDRNELRSTLYKACLRLQRASP